MLYHRKYYFPLQISLFEEDEYGDIDYSLEGCRYDGYYAENYRDEIEEKFDAYTEGDEDMVTYFDKSNTLRAKIESMQWGFEVVGNELYGTVDVKLNDEIDLKEDKLIKSYISGQNSDGLGEGFEQQDIRVDDVILNVHFWSCDDDYKIYTEEEMNTEQTRAFSMGAI